ncbi:MAG: DJ-1/PfpI family protein [bacterium]
MNARTVIKKSVLLFLPAEDFNETEFLSVKQMMENSGLKIFIASDANMLCKGSHGLKVKSDVSLYNVNVNSFSAIVIIGGNGIKKYWDNSLLHSIVIRFHKAGKTTSAICSASVVLAKAGLLKGVKAVCYPENKNEIEREGSEFIDAAVIVSSNIITGRDPQAASEFASRIISMLL